MPHSEAQAERVMKIITAASDAVKILTGVNGAAADSLARAAADEVQQVIRNIAKRSRQSARARRARRGR